MQDKKYRGHLELPNGTVVDLVNDDQVTIKDTAQSILKGTCRFAAASATDPSLLIYHPSFESGKVAIGWIATGVSQPMTNAAFLEQRHLQRQAA